MIGYVTIGAKDIHKSKEFYTALLAELGAGIAVDIERMVLFANSADAPMLGICTPYNEETPHPGNGAMVALIMESKAKVDALYTKALELGARCDGEPGQRIPDVFYGAYIRDFDGNKIAFYFQG